MSDLLTPDHDLTRRLARIELRIGEIDDVLRRLDTMDEQLRRAHITIAEINGRVSLLPTSWQVVTAIIGGQAAVAALILGSFLAFGLR